MSAKGKIRFVITGLIFATAVDVAFIGPIYGTELQNASPLWQTRNLQGACHKHKPMLRLQANSDILAVLARNEQASSTLAVNPKKRRSAALPECVDRGQPCVVNGTPCCFDPDENDPCFGVCEGTFPNTYGQ